MEDVSMYMHVYRRSIVSAAMSIWVWCRCGPGLILGLFGAEVALTGRWMSSNDSAVII